ncbi:MAG: sensor histidine kinase [Ferruginibacter sp.]
MKLCLAFLFFFYQISISFAQQKTDSLFNVVQHGADKEKVNALNALCDLLVYDKPAEAKLYGYQSIALAKKINYPEGLGDAHNKTGIVYDVTANYDSAIYQYNTALAIYQSLKNPRGEGSALNNLGLVYWNLSDYDKALKYFFDALQKFEDIKNERFIANAFNNIGLVYSDVKKPRLAIQYHSKAKDIYERLNDIYLRGAVYNNMANAYDNLEKMDSAGHYYHEAIAMHTLAQDDYGLSIAYAGYGTYLMALNQDDSALYYHKKSLVLKDSLHEESGKVILLINMSKLSQRGKDRRMELAYLQQALPLAAKNKLKKELLNIYQMLATYYEKDNPALSYDYFKKFAAVKDSVFNETSNQQITELNTRYETGKKELQLVAQQATIRQKDYVLYGIIIFAILLLLLAFTLYRRYQWKQEARLQQAILHEQSEAMKGIISAEENERKRIAADLHDGIGQMISVARMNLSALESDLVFKGETQKSSFEKVVNLLDESTRELRTVSHQMMPNALLTSGLSTAVKMFISRIDPRVLNVSLHTEGLHESLESNVEMVLYRVIQECVNNVLKHAHASQLDISIINDKDGISVSIEDNGKGFDTSKNKKSSGLGLQNISSRVLYLKGSVDFDSTPGKGTLVAIHVPLTYSRI